MSERMIELDSQIQALRRQMVQLYNRKGYFDQEILDVSEEIDKLVNESIKLQKEAS